MNKKSLSIMAILFICIALLLLNLNRIINKIESSRSITPNNSFSSYFKENLKVIKYAGNPIFKVNNPSNKKPSLAAGNCILKENKKTILIYYTTYKNSTAVRIAEGKNPQSLSDAQNEAILKPGKMGEWDDGGVSVFPNCIVKRSDGTYYMYYTGSKANGQDIYHTGTIGLATSKNLISWKKSSFNPILKPSEHGWDSMGVFEPSLYFTGNEYGAPGSFKMWYGGSDSNLRFQIGYAESSNGIEWIKYNLNPVLSYSNKKEEFDRYSIEVHSVTKINNGFALFYEAIQDQFPNRFRIGMALSKDGKNWIRSQSNPILEGGMVGEWDQFGAYHPSLVIENDKMLLYYVGLDYDYSHRIGIAELNPNLLNFQEFDQ